MLRKALADALAVDGPLAQAIPGFAPRAGQLAMAEAVADTLEQGSVLVVEAGTGIGKTFAYLVPALLGGGRVLVSTATKALQDQLFGRDIPQLLATLGLPTRVALLKGRSSYLCLSRLGGARHLGVLPRPADLKMLGVVEQWAQSTRSGDLAELSMLDEQSPVIPLVTSTRDNCTAGKCPQFQVCHVYRARREAMAADLVVINHHLFFADWNVRESGVAELLPTVNAVVFDEAHQLNEVGIQFLGKQLGSQQLQYWSRDLVSLGLLHARGFADWPELAMRLEGALAEWQLTCQRPADPATRLRWVGAAAPQGIAQSNWVHALTQVGSALEAALAALALVAAAAEELTTLLSRGQELAQRLAYFSEATPPEAVRWVESGVRLRMHESPLTVAAAMRERLSERHGGGPAWVFTSATLGTDEGLGQFVAAHGLDGARVLQLASPFDYSRQARLYIPREFPKPSDAQHSDAVAALVAQGAMALRGRTLVLTTTLRAMRRVAQVLRASLPSWAGVEVLLQGEASKRDLLARFTAAANSSGFVLVATGAFWEGVDVPGDALQMVVIDKIPFAPPDDPVVEARCQQMESEGLSPFAHYQLPQAALALKQGVGRLIRRETDRGILVICDVRLRTMSYGRGLLAALPAMPLLTQSEEFDSALEALTRPSTTDPSWSFPP